MKRRVLLTRVGSIAGLGVLAGCIDGAGNDGNGDPGSGADGNGGEETTDDENDDGTDEGEGEDGDDTDDRTSDDEEITTDPVADIAIETLEAACGTANEATIDVDLEAGKATITGFVRAPNPCHEAVLAGTVTENGTVTVTIGVESDGEDVCMECTGRVEYEATITFGEQAPTVLVVDHEHLEETTEVARRELDENEK